MPHDPDEILLVDEVARRVRARLQDGSHSQTTALGPPSALACAGVGPACDACRGCHVHRPQEVRNIVHLGAARIAAGSGHPAPAADLARFIDHTLLKADATRDDLKKLCDEAKRYGFATVCVNAANVRFCAAQLEGSAVRPIVVVGFPLGAGTSHAKAFEAREAIRNGAAEIDMVINIGALKSSDYSTVAEDISAVVGAAAPHPVKVILETGLLNHDQKVIACALAKLAGAAFVKTSTGFGPGGATAEDIALMRQVVGPDMGIKAAGGVRTEDDVRTMLKAGANRIGASASVAIVLGQSSAKAAAGKTRRVARGY